MKKIVLGLLLSCIGSSGYALPFCVADPLLKSFSTSSYSQGRRGHRGPRGPTGPVGKTGRSGKDVSFVADRAYLLAPTTLYPIDIDFDSLPMVVPVDHDDLQCPYFEDVTNSFIVPEGGVYQVDYFLKAARVNQVPRTSPAVDTSGLVIGLLIDADLSRAIGLRSLPLVSSTAPLADLVFGTHRIVIRLEKDQRIQLAVLAEPIQQGEGGGVISMQFVQTGSVVDEVAYLSIKKICE
jgi:hypothetical protein